MEILIIIIIISLGLSLTSLTVSLFWRPRIVIDWPDTVCSFDGIVLPGRTLGQIRPGVVPFAIIPSQVGGECTQRMLQGKKFKFIVKEAENGDLFNTDNSDGSGAGMVVDIGNQPGRVSGRFKNGMIYRMRGLLNRFNNKEAK